MEEYIIGFEEWFNRQVYERTPGHMNYYDAEELQAQATRASVELLNTLGYDARTNREGMLEVDRTIDSEGLEAIRKMFDEFRITSFVGKDEGAAPLLIQERPLEKIAESILHE